MRPNKKISRGEDEPRPVGPYYHFERVPNGLTTEFVKGICCEHSWLRTHDDNLPTLPDEDDDGELLYEHMCSRPDCTAISWKNAKGELVEYDNAEGIDLFRGGH